MVIKVHGNLNSTATLRVLACLNEKRLDYEFLAVNISVGEQKKEPFISLNVSSNKSLNKYYFSKLKTQNISFIDGKLYEPSQPYGQVPALEDGNLKLFESRAVNQYLVHKYTNKGTQFMSSDTEKMAIVFVWSEVESQKYDPPASKLTWELGIKPLLGMSTDDGIVKHQELELAKILDVYEDRLMKSKYLGGDSFTLADLHHLPTLHYLMPTRVKAVFDSRPRVSAWIADIMARPAWQKTVAMQSNQ